MGEREISEGLKSLITGMLNKDPKKRLTMNELRSHPWVNEGQNANLNDLGASMLANFTEEELKVKGINTADILMA